MRKADYDRSPLICEICPGAIPFKNRERSRFCSPACFHAFKRRDAKPKRATCLSCDVALESNQVKFCWNACQHRYQMGEAILNRPWTAYRRRSFLIETEGRKCSGCGLEKW